MHSSQCALGDFNSCCAVLLPQRSIEKDTSTKSGRPDRSKTFRDQRTRAFRRAGGSEEVRNNRCHGAKGSAGKVRSGRAAAMKTGAPFVEQEAEGFDVTAPLHDATGKLIGGLGIDFKQQHGQTKADVLKLTAALLKELEQQIPSKAFLFQSVSAD